MSEEREFEVALEQDEGFAYSVTFDQEGLPGLAMDEPPPLGAGAGPNAARMLGAAVGHCLSASLQFCLKRARVEVRGMRTTVQGRIARNEKGRYRIAGLRVRIEPDVEGDLGRCLGLFEDFCIVTASVRGGIDVEVEVAGS
jgi:uncharacterized OsmC-like protein